MSLRSRLWLVIGSLALLPTLVAGVVFGFVVPEMLDKQASGRLRASAAAVQASLQTLCREVGTAARAVAIDVGANGEANLGEALRRQQLAWGALLDRAGGVLLEAGTRPPMIGEPGSTPPCSGPGRQHATVVERVEVISPVLPHVARLVVARPLQADKLASRAPDADVALLDGSEVLITTGVGPDEAARLRAAAGADGTTRQGARLGVVLPPEQGAPWTVLVTGKRPATGGLWLAILAAAVASALLSLVLGWWIARSLTRPLDELSHAAERVAQGDFDLQVPVRSEDEVGRLGARFNEMTLRLRATIGELHRSHDEMAASLQRLGETLESTHDLDGLLNLVLDTAVAMSRADAGVALALDGHVFTLVAERDLELAGLTPPRRVTPGIGVLGSVAAAPGTIRGELGVGDGQLLAAPGEPSAGPVLATSLRRGARVVGVLGLYRRAGRPGFSAEEEEAVRTLAGQAGIAVDNVMLHREAQRLSITDALTGVWNFRYLSMSLAREIERANRFNRPLAVLMLDLDRFKEVNDTYGHARGDAVLRELAARIAEQVREVDTLARYGGEEFVLVLPETTLDGATMLAERICAAVRRDPFGDPDEQPLRVTVSIGVAAFPHHGASPATLMHAADEALYAAKRAGRDRWHVAPRGEDGAAPPERLPAGGRT